MTEKSVEQVCVLLDEFNKKIVIPYFGGDKFKAFIVLLDDELLKRGF